MCENTVRCPWFGSLFRKCASSFMVSVSNPAWDLTEGQTKRRKAGIAMAVLPAGQILMILGLTWISDTCAYLAGRAWGRRKLAPSISPGKTWEGVAGGAIGCVIYAIIWAVLEPDLRVRVQGGIWLLLLAGTLLLCALGIVGDLFESALKRQAGAKDSGRLLPGHGGVLDRIDSATAALPVALLLMQAIGNT